MSNQPANKPKTREDVVFAYHQQTKHHLSGYAKGPDTIDWADQPAAFRQYANTTTTDLPFTLDEVQTSYDHLFQKESTAKELNLSSLSGFLELSLGLSAWKQYGPDRWSLRCNPSSGNLHPTEAYLLLHNVNEIPDGIYHYRPDQHQLEKRCEIVIDNHKPTSTVLICLSSIHWREAWKYGERAFRYSQLDIGHAMATTRYAAACFGWKLHPYLDCSNIALNNLFGLDRDDYYANERETSDVLLSLQTEREAQSVSLENISTNNWRGKANQLNRKHFYDWPIINEIDNATESPGEIETESSDQLINYPVAAATTNELATTIIKQRRSAQYFDGQTIMSEATFWRMIDKLLPRTDCPPFDLLPWSARIHPVLFVHRVENLQRGLYVLPRHKTAKELLSKAFRPDFSWEKVTGNQQHLQLYKLVAANCENVARTLFCHQDIASQSAFAIGMLAEYRKQLINTPWRYRQLFWEAGVLGQALYLEAEANNLRATGVGCFFDDNFHEVLGIQDDALQSVYHFTIGTPIIDHRLVSLSGYHHIKRN